MGDVRIFTDDPNLEFVRDSDPSVSFQTFAQEMIGYGSVIMPILVAISALGSLSCHIMTSSRLCFVGARQGHIPDCLSLVTMNNFTPTPALVFLVTISQYKYKSCVFIGIRDNFIKKDLPKRFLIEQVHTMHFLSLV
jgi:amino acid transporter